MRDKQRAKLADLWHRRELAFQDWLLAKEQLNASTEQHRRITAAKTAAFRAQGISEAQLKRYRSCRDHLLSPRDPRTIEHYVRWRSVITMMDAQWESKLSVATADLERSTLRLAKAMSELLSVMPLAMVAELSGQAERSLLAMLPPLGDGALQKPGRFSITSAQRVSEAIRLALHESRRSNHGDKAHRRTA